MKLKKGPAQKRKRTKEISTAATTERKRIAESKKLEENERSRNQEEPTDNNCPDDSKLDNTAENVIATKRKWTNRERVLVFCARGAPYRHRHLMNDLKALMAHSKNESKLDKSTSLPDINEIAGMKNCTKCVYFETRKRKDVYMWMANIGEGPSVKFLVHNVHTTDELRLSGNCLRGSRPILNFDSKFETEPHFQLIKEMFTQTFGTPNFHPKSQPFIDHVFNFAITSDGRIWFRNFQIVKEGGELQEIGPRMVLEVIKVFAGSFQGSVLYENVNYQSPNLVRSQLKRAASGKYLDKQIAKRSLEKRRELAPAAYISDPLDELLFDTTSENKTENLDGNAKARCLKRAIETGKRGKSGLKSDKKWKLLNAADSSV